MAVISDILVRFDGERLMARFVPLMLALSAATVTTAYYEIHGPLLDLLMLLSVLWLLPPARRGRPLVLTCATQVLAAVFLVHALVAVLSAGRVGFNSDALHGLDRFSVFLGGAALIPLLVALRPRPAWFWPAIAATALLSGGYAFWEVHAFGESFQRMTGNEFRAGGSKGKQIPFGDIAALTTMLSLLGAVVHVETRRILASVLFLAACAGAYASLASGTRAAWIFLPSALILIGLFLRQRGLASGRAILLGFLAIALVGGIALSQSERVQGRVVTAIAEIQTYVPGPSVQPGDSMGERFEMWRAAWMAFQSQPLLGIGVGQLNAYFKQAAEAGVISRAISDFNDGEGHTHAHSDYLHALATCGILGLVSLLLLYLVPLGFFIRAALAGSDPDQQGLGYAGILLILAYMQFSLTDSILLMRITSGYFVLLCAWLLAMILTRRDGQA